MLNARYHEQEAHIIAQAGVPGTVTIATNMAGRGTDIQLGGNDRYRARDWLQGGDRRWPHGAPCTTQATTRTLRQWVDDILDAGDEWIDDRLKQRLRARSGHARFEQRSGSRVGPAGVPRRSPKKRARISKLTRPAT